MRLYIVKDYMYLPEYLFLNGYASKVPAEDTNYQARKVAFCEGSA